MRQFVPMNDDLLYQPDALPGPLVPYRCGVPCWHQLQTQPTADSKRDLDKIQAQINEWATQTGLPRRHISHIVAMSIGENHSPEALREYMGE